MNCSIRLIFILAFFAFCSDAHAQARNPIGVDCNYALDMSSQGKKWLGNDGPVDPLAHLAKSGCQVARIRLWVGDEGVNRLNYAIETARRAHAAGLKPYLVIFLSEEWADFVKQPAPKVWTNLPPEKKLAEIEAYAERVTRKFADAGVPIELFEIGNEIDFGICGVFEEEWPKRVSLEYMRTQFWPRMTPIIKAAQVGVLKAQPNAKFVLHITQWNNSAYCIAFWRAMLAAGVRLDQAGISYFPSNCAKTEERTFDFLKKQATIIVDAIKKPVLICETGYPSAEKFGGQFADWNHAVDAYPLTEAGQAKWIANLAAVVHADPHFAGAIYWSPEWYGGGIWDAFALFDSAGKARAGVRSFASQAAK